MRASVLLLAVALLGCGGAEKKVETDSDRGVDPAKASALLEQASVETSAGNWEKARELLGEAYRFSDVKIRARIEAAGERLDDAQAKAVAAKAKSLAEDDRCGDAFDAVATTVTEAGDGQVPGIVKKASEEALLGCAGELIETGELDKARAVVERPSAAVALDNEIYAELKTKLSDTIVAIVLSRMTPAMDLKNWVEASKMLQAAVDAGEVGDAEREILLEQVRRGISADVEKLVAEHFGGEEGASEALAQVDSLIAAGMWRPRVRVAQKKPKTASEKMLAQGGQEDGEKVKDTRPLVPEKLDRLRRELAFWVACNAVGCEEQPPAARWLYGNAWLHPLFAPKAKTEDSLSHAVKVWVIAAGSDLALVTREDPGKLADLAARAHVGRGWVATSNLKPEDTSEWLPPGQSIVGTLVWGPLREGSKEFELGTAMKVEGDSVGVERMSDRTLVTVPRRVLHFGRVKPGDKVLALCKGTSLTPARIEKVTIPKHRTLGDPKVKLTCEGEGGVTYEEQLGAVRTQRAWLPPRK